VAVNQVDEVFGMIMVSKRVKSKFMVKRIIIISLVCVLFGSVSGQTVWTLEECIVQGLKENLQLKQLSIDNTILKEDRRVSRLSLLPDLNSSISAGENYGRSIDPSTNDIISTEVFQTGLSIGTSLTVFKGFTLINKALFAKLNLLKGSHEEKVLKNDIAIKVMNAFYEVCFNRGLSQIAKDQRDMSMLNLKKVQIMVETGIRAQTEIADMTSRLALDEFKYTQAQNTVTRSILVLKQLLNLQGDKNFDIEFAGINTGTPGISLVDPDSVFQIAIKSMPQFKSMELDADLSKLNLTIAKGDRFPTVVANAGYNTGFYSSFKDEEGVMLPFSNQMKNNASQYVGLSLRLPVFNGWQVNRNVRVARLNYEKTQTTNEIRKRELYAEIQNACHALKAAADEFYSAVEQEKSAVYVQQLSEKKWEQDTGNLLELTDARNRLASARAEILRTYLQYEMRAKTLDVFTGKISY